MAISAPLEYLLVAALLCLSSLLLVQRRNVRWLPLPPGPKPLPLIGNLLDVPASFEWVTFAEWSREYNSDIIHYRVFGTSTIVLNSQRACHDLLEKKSNIYSSRPRWVMLNEVIGWGWAFTTMPYGKEWNARRKLFAHEFSPKQTERYQPHSLKAVRTFLLDLLSQPHNSQRLLRHMAGSAILSITYGLSIRSADVGDSVIDMAERALESFVTAAVPGTFWVDYLPVLKYIPSWFPGASFKRKAREWAKDVDEMLNMPFDIVKSNLTKGIVRPCFVSHCLSNINTLDPDEIVYNEKVAREAAGAMYEAGTDTTVVASITFILMMICHPEIQRKGQEELDRVVGQDRLPTFDDKENLPYVYAIINEVMRYQPVNPAALAHLVSEEDEYNGYRIPKDSVVIGNAWAILHDEDTYGPHTDTFDPSRFLTPEGKINSAIPEPTSFFGFGRRTCPGRHLANSTVFAVVASLLHSFNISGIGTMTQQYESSLQNRPVPFECEIRPRSARHEELIQSSVSMIDD